MSRLAEEDGVTLIELVVAMAIGVIVLVGAMTVLEAGTRSGNRTSARVQADQAGRPGLSRIIDELHSTCIGPGVAPILAGSTDSSITFLHATENDPGDVVSVSPTPDKRKIELTAGTLTDSVYAGSGNAPNWTFAATPQTFQIATGVGAASVGSPAVSVPLFRYFDYDAGGQLSTTPLPTPLTAAAAAKVVAVDVAFSVTPTKTTANPDTGAAVSLADSVLLRFLPAGSTGGVNLPCQ